MSDTILFGGSGFLGPIILARYPHIVSVGRSPIPSHLKNRHVTMPSLDDLSVLDSLDFDRVIFLIGSSNHHAINPHPTMGIDYNVYPLQKILFYLQKRRIKKFICFTTILLYDATKMTVPVDETQPINPYVNPYVFSKYISEEIVRFYAPKIPIIIVRFSNIYGPTRLIRPDLVPMLVQKALSPAKEITVWNTKPVRDFLYTPDAADAVVKLLETDFTGPVNLGTGRAVSVDHIAQTIGRLSGKKIRNLDKPVSGPMHFVCDISLVKRLTGWEPRHTIEEGLKETFETMKRYSNECRWWESETFQRYA